MASALLLLSVCAVIVAGLLNFFRAPLLRPLAQLSPRVRIRWIVGLMLTPLAIGAAVVTLALGHCVMHHVMGTVEDCAAGGAVECAFCLFNPSPVSAVTATFAAVVGLGVMYRLSLIGLGFLQARRARQRLRAVALCGPDGVWHVPGVRAFVIGWPSPVVCVGEKLVQRLDPDAVRAVTAHEQGHQERGDLLLRALGRALAMTHFAPVGAQLLASLDLAIEQACDEHASSTVRDPLIVADALILAARLQNEEEGSSPQDTSHALAARIEALCAEPNGGQLPAWTRWAARALVASAGLGVLLSHHIHQLVDQTIHWIHS